MDEVKSGVQYVFQTKNAVSLALSATGHAAMECVMTNMIECGDKVLIAENGIWGVRAADMAGRHGAEVSVSLSTAPAPLNVFPILCRHKRRRKRAKFSL